MISDSDHENYHSDQDTDNLDQNESPSKENRLSIIRIKTEKETR
jgi:hypothetical protein